MNATYRGEDHRGASVSGIPPEDLAPWVARKFRQGWRFLSVTRDGREVAGIQRSRIRGRSQWWSE